MSHDPLVHDDAQLVISNVGVGTNSDAMLQSYLLNHLKPHLNGTPILSVDFRRALARGVTTAFVRLEPSFDTARFVQRMRELPRPIRINKLDLVFRRNEAFFDLRRREPTRDRLHDGSPLRSRRRTRSPEGSRSRDAALNDDARFRGRSRSRSPKRSRFRSASRGTEYRSLSRAEDPVAQGPSP